MNTTATPARVVEPTRRLMDSNKATQHRYVPAHAQNERGVLATWVESRRPTAADLLEFDAWDREEA